MKQLQWILRLGINDTLIPYERRRAWIFNFCNSIGFMIATLRLLYLSVSGNHYSLPVLLVNCLPQLLCISMACCMYFGEYRTAVSTSFVAFPPALAIMAFCTNDRSMEIYLLLYMIFTFFFLHRRKRIILTFAWVLGWFGLVHFGMGQLFPQLLYYPNNIILSCMDYSTGLGLIFLTMYTIKFEVWKFETSIREKNEQLKSLNTVKDKIFSVIAHDLRTPVHSSVMLLRLLQKRGNDPAQLNDYVPEIIKGMEQTGELLDNLLEWAKSQMQNTALKKVEIAPWKITNQTIAFLQDHAGRKNIRLINEVCENLLAKADENSIRVVLRNLMANAIKFTRSGGFIKVRSQLKGNILTICVEDNGIGIAPEKQQLIFKEEYYTTPGTNKEMGSGLGLMICKELVSKNGGSLMFSNAPGGGSIFSFSLEAAAPMQTIQRTRDRVTMFA